MIKKEKLLLFPENLCLAIKTDRMRENKKNTCESIYKIQGENIRPKYMHDFTILNYNLKSII